MAHIATDVDDVPANPFDFEDPERFAPLETFPVGPDIIYVLGVRLELDEDGWMCPHGVWRYDKPDQVARRCLTYCKET